MVRDLSHPTLDEVTLGQLLAALADPVRLEIVRTIDAASEPLACNVVLASVPKSTASHHWKVLREAGLVHQQRLGTSKLNTVRREELDARFPGLLDAILRSAPSE